MYREKLNRKPIHSRAIALLMMASLGFFSVSCKTTQSFTKTNQDNQTVSLYSSGDEATTYSAIQRNPTVASSMSDLRRELKSHPEQVASWLNLAKLELASGNLDEAETAVKRGLEHDIKNTDAKLVLAQIYYRRGGLDMAEVLLNNITNQSKPDAQILNLRALIALQREDTSTAFALFKEVLKLDSGNIPARMNIGVLNLKYRQLGAASIQFERVLKVMPENTEAKFHLAIVHANRGQLERAEELYEEILDQEPQHALANYNLAILNKNKGEYATAIEYLKSYLNTPLARKSNTEPVFALIETIRNLEESQKGKSSVSDEEVQSLAKDIDLQVKQDRMAAASQKPTKAQPGAHEKISSPSEGKTKVSKKASDVKNEKNKNRSRSVDLEEDDIESLEKKLTE